MLPNSLGKRVPHSPFPTPALKLLVFHADIRGIDQDDEDSDDLERLHDCLDAFTREDEEEEDEEEETKDEETGTSEANHQVRGGGHQRLQIYCQGIIDWYEGRGAP